MNTSRCGQAWLLMALAGAGVLVRFWNLGGESLWMDEIFSMRITGGAFADVAPRAAAENAPPLYFWLLYLWRQVFGSSEAAVRVLSALLGSAAIWAIYDLGRRLAGKPAAMLAAILTAASCQQLYHAQEVRPYALLMLLATLSSSAWWHWRQQPHDARRAVLYTVLASACVYTHFFGVFVIVVHGLVWLVAKPEQVAWLKPWLLTNLFLSILLTPAALLIFSRGQHIAAGFWATTPDFEQLLRLYSQFYSLHLPPSGHDPKWSRVAYALPVGLGLGLVMACLGRRCLTSSVRAAPPASYVFLLFWLLLPPFTTWLIAQSPLKIFVFRYLSVSAPAALLLAALLLSALPPLWRWPLLGALLAIAIVHSHLYLTSVTRQQWRELAAYLQPRLQAGDGILFDDPIAKPLFDYYAPNAHYTTVVFGQAQPLPSRIWAVLFSIKDERRLRQEFSRLAAIGYDDVSRKSFFTILLLELRQNQSNTGNAP